MDEELKETLYRIINELPDECSWLDYKEIPYLDKQRAEFIRDLCAFLNSNESFEKDKYIILGVTNDKKTIGLRNVPMQDDSWYQTLADYIFPRPSIRTGTFKYTIKDSEVEFGYILIYGTNVDRIYEINRQAYYGPEKPNSHSELEEYSVYPSTAWIRMGSCKRFLTEYDRRKIYEIDRKNELDITTIIPNYQNVNITSDNEKIIKAVTLFGGWDEENENDKNIISEFIGKPYEQWISILRTMLKDKTNFLEFKNNKWIIQDRFTNLKKYANDYFKDELEKFKKDVIQILSERNPKFDLSSDKRSMSNIYNKTLTYSNLLRKSVAETLPIITANYKEFKNCINTALNLSLLVVREILKNDNWEIWASLGELLPLLAEASPEEFLYQLEDKIRNSPSLIKQLFNENESYITTSNYSTGLYWSLELIAWEPRNLIETGMILTKLASFDKEAIKHIANIILPWYPQTKSPIENRIILVKNILKEYPIYGWNLLMYLMPGKITVASPSYKPKYINKIEEENEVLQNDYWEQISKYFELAIENSKTNTEKICDLIDLIDDVPKNLFDKIYAKLSSKKIVTLSETRRFIIWNHLEDFIVWHKKISKSQNSIATEMNKSIQLLSKSLKPQNITIYAKRYFRKDTWHLVDDRKDYKIGEQQLYKIQLNLAGKILSLGIEKCINFAKNIEDSYLFGICNAELNLSKSLEEKIMNHLESKNLKLVDYAKGYTYKTFKLNGFKWIETLSMNNWSMHKKLNFLLVLPHDKKTFELVKSQMGTNQVNYWKNVDIRIVNDIDDLNYATEMLLNADRPEKSLWLICSSLYRDNSCNYNKDIAINCLKLMLKHQERLSNLDAHHITQIIKNLQDSDISQEELFNIEWSYLPLLDGREARPITIEKMMSDDPKVYNDILCLAYKPHSMKSNPKKVNENVATNAYRLLNQWKLVPGLSNGIIDKEKLNNWYVQMIDICKKSDRLEVGLSNFGKVLYHSPKDKSGFWIDKNVAEILNKDDADIIRSGFHTEAFNSLGVINYDPEGSVFESLAKEYEEKAISADTEGFYKLAKEMRKLADTYKYEAEHTREHYYDFE